MKIGDFLIRNFIFFLFILWIFSSCTSQLKKTRYNYDHMDSDTESLHKKVEAVLESCIEEKDPITISRYTRIDSVTIDEENEHADIYLNRYFAQIPLREETVEKFYDALYDQYGWFDTEYALTVYSTNNRIEELVPNYYRSDTSKYDKSRLKKPFEKGKGEISYLAIILNGNTFCFLYYYS